jgi:hypothetical protein
MFNVDKKVPTTELERQQQVESVIDFKIEKNIPLTHNGGKAGRIQSQTTTKALQTLDKMEVGDSFVVTRTTCTKNQFLGLTKAMSREIKKRNLPYSIKTSITTNTNKEFISARVWLIG